MKVISWALAAALGLAALPAYAADTAAPGGVYDCFGPKLAGGKYLDLDISGAKFSVISPGQYLSRGGKTGHFKFDGLTLSMVDGPYSGLKFHKAGEEGPFMCPRNVAKDMHNSNAW